jgi:hypothetical protein
MRRRDVLVGGLAWAQLIASRSARAQGTTPVTRAAVVIGVNKTGNLPVLRAAVSAAKSVADWLDKEHFNIVPILDDKGPVTAGAIKQAVTSFVNQPSLTQLVVYFSGHGMSVAFNEYWLLSGAPDDPNEAVSLVECFELAHMSGIPNVVFISDACRSSSPDFQSGLIHGTLIFPNRPAPPGASQTDVDRFLATGPGAASFEAKVAADSYQAIYTTTFLDAFAHPYSGMVQTVGPDSVIPNYKLKDFLSKEVPRRLGNIDPKYVQYPDTRIESRDNNYIGHALAAAASPPVVLSENATVLDVANYHIDRSSIGALSSIQKFDVKVLDQVAVDSGFQAAQKSVFKAQAVPKSNDPHQLNPVPADVRTGFSISGAKLRAALATGGARAEIISPGNGRDVPAVVRVLPPGPPAVTVGLLFEDGSGTVVAALPEFIGTLTVEGGRVASGTYLPNVGSYLWPEYQQGQEERLNELHALVATAAKYGVFRIEGAKEDKQKAGARLADKIRVLKSIDPTLGVYAAYAYADSDLIGQVQSVRSYVREDLNVDLFDLALLANVLSGKPVDGRGDVVPFCPMLTQGWQLLRVKGVSLPEQVERARDDMRDALWTTFGPRGMDLVFSAIQSVGFRNNG